MRTKKLVGNFLLVLATIIFFFALLFSIDFLRYGFFIYLLTNLAIIGIFVVIVISVSKFFGLSLKYEKTSFSGRIVPYLFLAFFGMNILTFLSGFTYVIGVALLFLLLLLFSKYAPENWKNKLTIYTYKWLKIWIIFAIIVLIITLSHVF